MTKHPTIIVTGSSGLVGVGLVSHLTRRGYSVRALQRRPPLEKTANVQYVHFDLSNVTDLGFEGADAIIHCAYQPEVSPTQRIHGPNVDLEGTAQVLKLARKYSMRVVFLSSLSAHSGAISYYGQNKLRVERLFDPRRDLILRLGIVLGGTGGLFGKLLTSLKRYPIVPLLDSGRQEVQTVALSDLCRVIERGIALNKTGALVAAHPAVLSMRDLYERIATEAGVRPQYIPVPAQFAYWVARACELMSIRLSFTSQNVLGLKDLRTFVSAREPVIFDIPLQDYQEALKHEIS